MMPMPCPRSAEDVIRVSRSPGPRSRIHSAPASRCAVDSLDPVDGIDEDTLCKFTRTVGVETATGRPAADEFDGLGQCGVMEADFGVERIEGRSEDGTATLLGLSLASFFGFDLLATLLHACQLSGRSGRERRGDGRCGWRGQPRVRGQHPRQARRRWRRDARDRRPRPQTIGFAEAPAMTPRRRPTRLAAAPTSCATARSSPSSLPCAATAAVASRPCEWPMTAAGGLPARSRP